MSPLINTFNTDSDWGNCNFPQIDNVIYSDATTGLGNHQPCQKSCSSWGTCTQNVNTTSNIPLTTTNPSSSYWPQSSKMIQHNTTQGFQFNKKPCQEMNFPQSDTQVGNFNQNCSYQNSNSIQTSTMIQRHHPYRRGEIQSMSQTPVAAIRPTVQQHPNHHQQQQQINDHRSNYIYNNNNNNGRQLQQLQHTQHYQQHHGSIVNYQTPPPFQRQWQQQYSGSQNQYNNNYSQKQQVYNSKQQYQQQSTIHHHQQQQHQFEHQQHRNNINNYYDTHASMSIGAGTVAAAAGASSMLSTGFPDARPSIPCQGNQPWTYAYCYGYGPYSNQDPCQYTQVIDIEDFM